MVAESLNPLVCTAMRNIEQKKGHDKLDWDKIVLLSCWTHTVTDSTKDKNITHIVYWMQI